MAKRFEIAFNIAARLGSGFTNAFSSASAVMSHLQTNVSVLKGDLKTLDNAYKKGIISAQSYTNAHKMMSVELAKVSSAQERLAKAMSKRKVLEEGKQKFRDNLWNTAETAMVLGAPVVAAMKFESAMADVKKVVDFDTPEQFKEMSRDIIELSKRIPMTADQLAQIVAAGGQSGIAREDLTKFAEDSAKMGVAFDVTAEQAGQMMAQWRTAFRMNQDEVRGLADQINYLGNTTAASAPKISEVVTRIGPLGEIGGVASGQIAALGATMIGVGIGEEVAATGIKNMILGLVAGEGATKSQIAAFEALGISSVELAKHMQEDAQGAILSVLKALQKLPKYQQASVLSDLFGKESLGAISPLLTNLEELERNFAKVGDKTKYAGSMQAEYDARAATTENKLILMKNSLYAVGITMGNVFLPIVSNVAESVAAAASAVNRFTNKFPNLSKWLLLGVGGIMATTVAVSALGYVIAGLALPFFTVWEWINKIRAATVLSTAATNAHTVASRANAAASWLMTNAKIALTAVTGGLVKAQMMLNAAWMANPIGLVIAGVAALAGTVYLLYQNFDMVRNAIDSAWAAFQATFPNAAIIIQTIGDKIAWVGKLFKGMFGGANVSAGPSVTAEIPAYASGTIATKPHIGLIAEAGEEAIIPLDGSPRSQALWAEAGSRMGLIGGGAGASGGGLVINNYQTINISGNVDATEVAQAVRKENDNLAQRLEAILNQQRRLSFA